jgi:dihydropteroate synthase
MVAKGKAFEKKFSLNLGGKLLHLDSPKVMGILNLTANSFYDGGKHNSTEAALRQCEKMLEEGATFIDVGANSTKPGASMLAPAEEQAILMPILKALIRHFPQACFSIDTFNSTTARMAIEAGAHMINDVSGGDLDAEMFATLAELRVPYVAMHMQGNPLNMQQNPTYTNVTEEVCFALSKKVEALHKHGLNDILLDPGFGFGKTLAHNYTLLNGLERLHLLEKPLLVGLSRKSMVYKVLGKPNSQEALNGTTALHTLALLKGVHILRVHDVKEAMEVIKIVHYTQNIR